MLCAAIIVLAVFGVRMCIHVANTDNDNFEVAEKSIEATVSPADEVLVDSVENARSRRIERKRFNDSLKRIKKIQPPRRLRSPLDEPVPSERRQQ